MISYLKDTNAVEVYNGSAWVASDDPNAIQNTIVDAKGDLITATAADTPARLAVGSNGDTLVADSATSTGLRYIPYGSINYAVNGGMDIWQRGTSTTNVSSAAPYVADRWYAYTGATAFDYTRQTASLEGFQYCLRVQRPTGSTGTTAAGGQVRQVVETANSVFLANKLITFSFWARKGANYSSASDALTISSSQGTGTDTGKHDTFTSGTTLFSGTATLTTSWQRFSFSTTAASTTTQISIGFSYTPVGTAGAADYYEVTGVQLEIGGTATAFRRAGGTIQGELAACQRYYVRWQSALDPYPRAGIGIAASTTQAKILLFQPVQMRGNGPSILDYSNLAVYDGVTLTAVTSATINSYTPLISEVFANVASGLTQYRPYQLFGNGSTNYYIGLSAEL